MHIIAIAWIYVVSMMALTEKSVLAGLMTLLLYCALPLGLVWFIFARKKPGSASPEQKTQPAESDRSDNTG